MTDIATLGIAINTTQLTQATQGLNQLSTAAESSEDAVQDLGGAANNTENNLGATTRATNKKGTHVDPKRTNNNNLKNAPWH